MLVARARSWCGEQTEHVYTDTDEYQAGTWNHARRVVIKAEVVRLGDREPRDNPRFVVTNLRQTRAVEDVRRAAHWSLPAVGDRIRFRHRLPVAESGSPRIIRAERRQGCGKRPGRRAGSQYGRQACRRRPAQVDDIHQAPLPTKCPDCGGVVAVERVATQYQEDLPVVRPVVRRFDIEVGHCAQCRRRVQGRHALQTSDALGAARLQLGPEVAALVVQMHTQMGPRPMVDVC